MARIILITGGCGFLGSHLVNEFSSCGDYDEIKIFDLKQYNENLYNEKNENCKITSIVGDIRNYAQISEALIGVTSVIHNASAVDVSQFADDKYLNDVNVNGTKTLIEACINLNVQYLVYTSTVDVAVPLKEVKNALVIDETLSLPHVLLYKAYGESKLVAEGLILKANGLKKMRTLCLRPTVLYGENDTLYIPSMLKTAKKCYGYLTPMGSKYTLMQQTYVGNAAWAHVCSLRALRGNSTTKSQSYYITDNSPPTNAFQFAEPFLKLHGYKLTKFNIPYPVINILFLIMQFFVALVHWPVEKICGNCNAKSFNLDPSLNSVKYVTRSHIFDSTLARNELNFSPKYDYNTALKRSEIWYAKLQL